MVHVAEKNTAVLKACYTLKSDLPQTAEIRVQDDSQNLE